MAESSDDEYKPVCIFSEQPSENVYSYCDNKINDKDAVKTCKLDMCNLCCSTIDTMKSKFYSLDTIKKCFKDCSEKFNY
jgi:hypothetical protein